MRAEYPLCCPGPVTVPAAVVLVGKPVCARSLPPFHSEVVQVGCLRPHSVPLPLPTTSPRCQLGLSHMLVPDLSLHNPWTQICDPSLRYFSTSPRLGFSGLTWAADQAGLRSDPRGAWFLLAPDFGLDKPLAPGFCLPIPSATAGIQHLPVATHCTLHIPEIQDAIQHVPPATEFSFCISQWPQTSAGASQSPRISCRTSYWTKISHCAFHRGLQ